MRRVLRQGSLPAPARRGLATASAEVAPRQSTTQSIARAITAFLTPSTPSVLRSIWNSVSRADSPVACRQTYVFRSTSPKFFRSIQVRHRRRACLPLPERVLLARPFSRLLACAQWPSSAQIFEAVRSLHLRLHGEVCGRLRFATCFPGEVRVFLSTHNCLCIQLRPTAAMFVGPPA